MDKNFLPLLLTDFFQKISNFPDFSWSSKKFPDFPGVETLPLLVEIPRSKRKSHQGVIHKTFLGGGRTKKCDHVCDQLGICIEYPYISEFILHQGKFVRVKCVKIPGLAPLEVSKYIKTVKQCAWAFKACVCYFYQIFIFSPNDSLSKTTKNAFYFIKKALFVLDIIKCFYFCPPVFFSLLAITLDDDRR